MEIIELRNLDQFEECTKVQKKVWGLKSQDVLPSHFMRAYADNEDSWGILLGFYDDKKQMLGISLSFPTSHADVYLLHMLGVLPDAQHNNIGNQLIEKTKDICAQRSVKKIVFTYDPLESVNANLYINKQNGICKHYVTNYYQMHGSQLHAGFPSDRLKVEIAVNKNTENKKITKPTHKKTVRIEIPLNFQEEKNHDINFALEWRNKTRLLFNKYINEEAYLITGFSFIKGEKLGAYILEK